MATYSWQDVSVNPGLTYIFASMTIHAVASSLIIYKLCMVHRSIRRTLNQQGAGYMSIVYIMTESAFLYTSWALICVVASLTNSPGQYAVIPAMGQIQVRDRYHICVDPLSQSFVGHTSFSHHVSGGTQRSSAKRAYLFHLFCQVFNDCDSPPTTPVTKSPLDLDK